MDAHEFQIYVRQEWNDALSQFSDDEYGCEAYDHLVQNNPEIREIHNNWVKLIGEEQFIGIKGCKNRFEKFIAAIPKLINEPKEIKNMSFASNQSTGKSANCKVLDSIKFVKSQVHKMDKAIDIAYACMLSKLPCLFIGNPGNAKTYVSEMIASMFGERDIDWSFNQFTAKTSPSKVFGGMVAQEMLKGIETYNLSVGAATKVANVFDELFKSTHPDMMTTLLPYFNEKPTIFSGGKNITPKWELVMCTSNIEDLPENLKFDPLWDRMGAKFLIEDLTNADSRIALKMKMKMQKQKNIDAENISLSIEDLHNARKSASNIVIPDSMMNTFYEKVIPVLQQYARVSQRKINSIFVGKKGCPSILQSLMYVTGELTDEVLGYLPYFIWQNIKTIKKMVEDVESVIIPAIVKTYKQIIEATENFIKNAENNAYSNYDTAKQALNILRESSNTTLMAFDEKQKSQVPIVVREYARSVMKTADSVIDSMAAKLLNDVDF